MTLMMTLLLRMVAEQVMTMCPRGQPGVTTLDNELCTLLAKITAAAGIQNNFAAQIQHYGSTQEQS